MNLSINIDYYIGLFVVLFIDIGELKHALINAFCISFENELTDQAYLQDHHNSNICQTCV